MSKPPTQLSASLDALPNTIVAASILPFVNSTALLNFRLASRGCYEICHGHDVGSDTATRQQHEEESDALWCLALVRDYRFEKGDESLSMYKSIRCNNPDPNDETNPFLSTSDVFTAPTAFISWKHWRKIDTCLRHDENGRKFYVMPSARVVGPYFLRAASLWRKIEQWCSDENMSENLGPAILSNLKPGKPVGASLVGYDGCQHGTLSAFKAVYSFYCGQNVEEISVGEWESRTKLLLGFFGGYGAYNTLSLNCWCPPGILASGHDLLLTQDVNDMKMTVFDSMSGQVFIYINSPNRLGARRIEAVLDGSDDDQILRWFENHADRLNNYSVGQLAADSAKSILRYPSLNDSTNCSRAVTRGIEVIASSIYAVELGGGTFVYSIRMRLLKPEDGEDYMSPEERGFDTCQLVSRYWRITQGGEVGEVRGEGVIGCYPLLREGSFQTFISEDGGRTFEDDGGDLGEKYFSYQSCTGGEDGEMEGYLQFRPGSIQAEAGEVFDVRVAPFPLKRPQHYQY